MSSEIAIEVEDFWFAYHRASRPTLRRIALKVRAGELVLLTGVSGCGKSTLALALAGMIPSQVHGEVRGRIHSRGHPIGPVPVREASRYVGLVFQNPNLQLFHQRVESEVAFGPENLCLPGEEVRARVARALAATGMVDLRHATISNLSGGQKQRTAIAATMAMGPDVLVLDEPLSDLDPVGAQEVLHQLRRLADEHGAAIVLIEHRVDDVLGWCDRVLLMDDGQILLDAPARAAFENPAPWQRSGVGLPDIVRVGRAFPEIFPGAQPLTAAEAAAALAGTPLQSALREALRIGAGAASAVPAGRPALTWEGVSIAFGGPPVLDDVTLGIDAGSWTALVGANGCGKTTLAHTAVGLQELDRGEVRVLDEPVDTKRVGAQAGIVALLLQAADEMLFCETVSKELAFGAKYRKRDLASPFLDLGAITEAFGFAEMGDCSPWELSQGGRQRLALGALLVGAPALLILDEPTTGQDNEHRRAFMALLDMIRKEAEMTLLMVTHDMRSVASRAQRLIVLGDAAVQLDGQPHAVFARGEELAQWGVLPPPVARLQHELVPDASRVALEVDELVALMSPARQPEQVQV